MSELKFYCHDCGVEIPIEREALRRCGPCTIRDMCKHQQAPAGSGFESFVDENMFSKPVVVKSSNHWKELQKVAGVQHIGTDRGNKLEAHKDIVARTVERANMMKAAKKKMERDIKSGNLPPDFGKKKPYDHRKQLELERRRSEHVTTITV